MQPSLDSEPAKEELKSAGEPADQWYIAARRTAVIAGIFSSLLAIYLLYNNAKMYGGLGRNKLQVVTSKEIRKKKALLLKNPQDEKLREEIRELDYRAREEFFWRRRVSHRGAILLLVSGIVFLCAVKLALRRKRQAPVPPDGPRPETIDAIAAANSRLAAGLVGAVLVSCALGLHFGGGPVHEFWSAGNEKSGRGVPGDKKGPGKKKVRLKPPPTQAEIARQWPRFRGPRGLGISRAANVPLTWEASKSRGILWKVEVPLPGFNSPIVWGKRIFLTGATKKKREVFCFDATTGRLMWRRKVETREGKRAGPPDAEFAGYAAPTAATDGRVVCAIFANGEIACFQTNGKLLWARHLGLPENVYGHASSLDIWKNYVLVLMDQGSGDDGKSRLYALDVATGKTVWETPRPVPNSWGSPIIVDVDGDEQIITCGDPWVIAYGPEYGDEVWRARCLSGDIGPSPTYASGTVFAANDGAQAVAIPATGNGDVTDNILWSIEENLPDTSSPLCDGDRLYLVSQGYVACYKAKTGERLWEQDMESDFTGSPTLVNDRIYLPSKDGVVFVFKAADKYEELARNKLGEEIMTSPAIVRGRIYIRGKKHLFCIGSKDDPGANKPEEPK